MELPESFPRIETLAQAQALGPVLEEVLHYSPEWAGKVFSGTGTTYGASGPDTLNAELQSCWREYWKPDEKRRILVGYVAARIER